MVAEVAFVCTCRHNLFCFMKKSAQLQETQAGVVLNRERFWCDAHIDKQSILSERCRILRVIASVTNFSLGMLLTFQAEYGVQIMKINPSSNL